MTPNKEASNGATSGSPLINKIHIVDVSEKGGVGKSVMFMSIASVLRNPDFLELNGFARPLKVAAFSADAENTGVLSLMGGQSDNAYETVRQINLNNREGRDELVNLLDVYADADVILVDFPANSMKVISGMGEDPDSYFGEFTAAGFQNYVLTPMDSSKDSVDAIAKAAANFGKLPTYITAVNRFSVDPSKSNSVYNTDYLPIKERIFKGKDHIEWQFPLLDFDYKTFQQYGRPYFQAGNDLGEHVGHFYLSRMDRKRWRDTFNAIEALLVPLLKI